MSGVPVIADGMDSLLADGLLIPAGLRPGTGTALRLRCWPGRGAVASFRAGSRRSGRRSVMTLRAATPFTAAAARPADAHRRADGASRTDRSPA